MKKENKNLFFSLLILWIVEIFRYAIDYNFDFAFFFTWLIAGFGFSVATAIIGIILGGLVLFNIFLFIYNIFKPDNELSFDYIDKATAGVLFTIIFEIISVFRKLI